MWSSAALEAEDPHQIETYGSPPRNSGQACTFASMNELFAGLIVVGFANGISESATNMVLEEGLLTAVLSTFNISVLVWVALASGVSFLLRGPTLPLTRLGWIAAGIALAAILVPITPLSWLAIAGLALYAIAQSSPSSHLRRGAWILLAMTVPMFWGRLLFATMSDIILKGDALLVSWIVGSSRVGNVVQFADGSGYLWIAPACSSLANISLAILCWTTFSRILNRHGSPNDVLWVLGASATVVAINVIRISLIGLHPEYYELIHGPLGSTAANWLTFAAMSAICLFGVRHDLPPSRA
jgi:exosortase/archaeosortase family protein